MVYYLIPDCLKAYMLKKMARNGEASYRPIKDLLVSSQPARPPLSMPEGLQPKDGAGGALRQKLIWEG